MRTKLRRKLDELSASFWSDDELNDFIDEGYFEIWEVLLNARHNGCLKNTTLNITGGVSTIALPSDFQSARLVERVLPNGTYPLWWDERFMEPNFTAGVAVTDGYLPEVRFEGQNMVLEPTPLDTVSGGIKLTYYFYPSRLSADTGDSGTPHPALHDFYHDLIVYHAVLLAKAKEEAIGGGGADLGAWGVIMQQREEKLKASIEVPSTQRQCVEPFDPYYL